MKQVEISIQSIENPQQSEASETLALSDMSTTKRANTGANANIGGNSYEHTSKRPEPGFNACQRSSIYPGNSVKQSRGSLLEDDFEPVRLVGTDDADMNVLDELAFPESQSRDSGPCSARSSVSSFSDSKAEETARLQPKKANARARLRSFFGAHAASSFNRYFSRVTRLTWVVYSIEALLGLALVVACVVMLYSDHKRGFLQRRYSFFVHVPIEALDGRTELFRWALIVAFALGLGFFVFRTLALGPFLISGFGRMTGVAFSERVKAEIVHFMNLKWYLSMVFFLLGLVLFGNHVFNESLDSSRHWEFFCRRSLIALLLFFAILFVQKLVMQRIAISFHRVHYADRVKTNNMAIKVIMTLKRFALKTMPCSERPSGDPMDSLLSSVTQIRQAPSRVEEKRTSGLEDETASAEDTKSQAAELAAFIFSAFQLQREEASAATTHLDSRPLTPADFLVVFRAEDVATAFDLLDRDGNGDITPEELTDAIVEAFVQRNRLLQALEESVLIISQLELLFCCMAMVLFLAVCLPVFDLPTSSLAAFGTFFLGLGFIFGPLATRLLQSIVFIFVTHPYDVGDRVSVSSEFQNVVVHEISLLTTTFVRPNGKVVYIPNATLGSSFIENIRRSSSQSELVVLEVPSCTPMERLFELKDKIRCFLEQESRDFNCGPDFFTFSLSSPEKLVLTVCLEHRSNFQDPVLQWRRKNKFNVFFVEAACSLGVVVCEPEK